MPLSGLSREKIIRDKINHCHSLLSITKTSSELSIRLLIEAKEHLIEASEDSDQHLERSRISPQRKDENQQRDC